MMMNRTNFMNRVEYKTLLYELFCSIDKYALEYVASRVIKVTPRFEQFISEVESIRTRLDGAIDTRDDGR